MWAVSARRDGGVGDEGMGNLRRYLLFMEARAPNGRLGNDEDLEVAVSTGERERRRHG